MRAPLNTRTAQNVPTAPPTLSAARKKAHRSCGTRYFRRPRASYKDQDMLRVFLPLEERSRRKAVDFANAFETKSAILFRDVAYSLSYFKSKFTAHK